MNKLKYILGSLFLLTSAPVLADPAMPDTVIDDGGMINTVWVAGDYQVVADTFNSIGMLEDAVVLEGLAVMILFFGVLCFLLPLSA